LEGKGVRMIDGSGIAETADRLRSLSYKYSVTPKHMAMCLLAMADLMEQYGVIINPHDGTNIVQVFRLLARELMR